MEEIYAEEYEMDWFDREELYRLVGERWREKSTFDLMASNVLTELGHLLIDLGIVRYNKLEIDKFEKKHGNIQIWIKDEEIEENLLYMEQDRIREELEKRFKRINNIEWEWDSERWKCKIEESLEVV